MLEVSASAGASGLSPLCLLTPVVYSVVSKLPVHDICSRARSKRRRTFPDASPRIATRCAFFLLDVESTTA